MFNKNNLVLAIILSAVLAPFILYSSSRTPWVATGANVSLWQEFIYPVEYLWHESLSGVKKTWRDYIALTETASENKILRKKLARLQIRIMDYEHQVSEARRLRKLLGFYKQMPHPLVAAEVIGSTGSTPFKSIRITQGSMDGLSVGMPVISADGIIGRIIRSGLKFSDVQLLEDSNFYLDVLVERTRVRGILQGASDDRCRLKLHRLADIRIGDTLITSGIISGFPKGLKVGRVVKINYATDNISQTILVAPWADYRQHEEVLVIKTSDQEIRDITETVGKDWLEKAISKKSTR